jgi:aryl-alcohol dehydrogenase-like predicted oxidoreductase
MDYAIALSSRLASRGIHGQLTFYRWHIVNSDIRGHSEEIVGKALADEGRRERAVLATKVALEWVDGKVCRNSTPERIREEIEDSLRRLRTDRVDLYQVHWPDPLVRIEVTAESLLELQREGKSLALGVSNYSPEQMDA